MITISLFILCSICLKALHSQPSCTKLWRLTVADVKVVLSSWVNGLSAPQSGKSGKPLEVEKLHLQKGSDIWLEKTDQKSDFSPWELLFTQIWIFLCSGQLLAKIGKVPPTEFFHQISKVEKSSKKNLNACNFINILSATKYHFLFELSKSQGLHGRF